MILPEKMSATCCFVTSFVKLERCTRTPIPSHAMGIAERPGASVPVTAMWAWPDLTISIGFELRVPHDIEIGSRVGFFKGASEGIDGRQFRSVAGDGQASGDIRKGDEGIPQLNRMLRPSGSTSLAIMRSPWGRGGYWEETDDTLHMPATINVG